MSDWLIVWLIVWFGLTAALGVRAQMEWWLPSTVEGNDE
jgi:hypothetical protein